MEELLALLERYSPGYRQRIEGYPDFIIDELEEVFGHPLPGFYRVFARTLGAQAGPLLAHVRSYDPILGVADNYRSAPNGVMPPRRFLFIFGDRDPLAPAPYWLDLESPSEEGDCQVVRMAFGANSWKESLSRSYISLRELLFLWAMEYLHLPAFPHRAEFHSRGGEADTVEDLARLLGKMDFGRLPYPRYSMLFEREDAAIRLYRPPGQSHFTLRVGMRGPEELQRFQMLLEDNTDLEKSRP